MRKLLRHGEKSSHTRPLNRPKSPLRAPDPLGAAIVLSMSTFHFTKTSVMEGESGCLTQLALTESCQRLNPGSAGADELIRATRRATIVDRSEIAIDSLPPEDHEVVSGASLHKGVSAR
jgi:hypothetical protein